MTRFIYFLFTFFALFIFPPNASSNVSISNGNYFTGFIDFFYPGSATSVNEVKVERVYNSKSSFKGPFGPGWGTDYDVYLSIEADSSVVVHEYGGGAENRFIPVGFKASDLASAVESIVSAAKSLRIIGSEKQLVEYRSKLMSNAEFRNSEWNNFSKQGKVQAKKLAAGTQLISNKYAYQFITKIADKEGEGYIRSYENGKVQRFNEQGKLVKVSDKNGNFLVFDYEKDGRLKKLTDNFSRRMFYTFYSSGAKDGLLKEISGANNKRAFYDYNNKGELIFSRDVDNNTYTYTYDTTGRHNLKSITYSDKTSLEIDYYGLDQNENVKSVKERDGSISLYKYSRNPSDPGYTKIEVEVRGKDKKIISKNEYEYFKKKKADGEEWTAKLITNLDGLRTETFYDEFCGLPTQIKRGSQVTSFVYDKKCRVIKKVTPQEVTDIKYDEKSGKVQLVEKGVAGAPRYWASYTYDTKGNLVLATTSDKKKVKLVYDTAGRIQALVDQNMRQITFKYNEQSKPTEITDPKLGTLKVVYDNSGELKKVDSTGGAQVASQIGAAFENLLEIIKPAGVNLSF